MSVMFEGEHLCYKFTCSELVIEKRYGINIYCDRAEICQKDGCVLPGVTLSDAISGPRISKLVECGFRDAFITAQGMIECCIIGAENM